MVGVNLLIRANVKALIYKSSYVVGAKIMSLTATAQMSTHVKTHSLYFPVDRLVHACWNRLFMA